MKTFNELYNEVMNSDVLKAEFVEASKSQDDIKAFLEKYGCSSDWEEVVAFFKEQSDRDLSEEELAAAAGGKINWSGITMSIITCGSYCAVSGAISASKDDVSTSDCINIF